MNIMKIHFKWNVSVNILLIYWYLPSVRLERNECKAIVNDDVRNCTSTSTEYLANRNSLDFQCKQLRKQANVQCARNSFCQQVFNISYFPQMLFTTTMKEAILNMIRRCCDKCAKCQLLYELSNISQLTPDLVNRSDIIFPVLGQASVKKMYGNYFIPVFKVPSFFYFTVKESGNAKMTKVIFACLKMWPLLVICLLMSLIAGFVTWAFEMRKNVAEFPKAFHVGVFEGFWWGFVSMTTVGYGDKTPKTFAGRMFAILWILIGITICSIFTASLTTEIINARKSANPDILGKRVGVLQHRIHDSSLVAQHGGIIHQLNISKTTTGIRRLMELLLDGKSIDGFVINMNTYYFFKRRKKKLAKAMKKMIKTEKFLEGESVLTGILLKTFEQYNYFIKYFQTNRIQLESCHNLRLNLKKTEDEEEKVSLFSPRAGLFISFLYYSIGLLGVIIGFGIFYEIRRHQKTRRHTETEEELSLSRGSDGLMCNKVHFSKINSCFKSST